MIVINFFENKIILFQQFSPKLVVYRANGAKSFLKLALCMKIINCLESVKCSSHIFPSGLKEKVS